MWGTLGERKGLDEGIRVGGVGWTEGGNSYGVVVHGGDEAADGCSVVDID